jgi:hypothetical protein
MGSKAEVAGMEGLAIEVLDDQRLAVLAGNDRLVTLDDQMALHQILIASDFIQS